MRALSPASVVTVAAATCLLSASAAYANPPGRTGSVEMHDPASGDLLQADEPRVCTFTLRASGFDRGERINWRVVQLPPTGTRGTVAETGQLIPGEEREGDVRPVSLKDGHYRLLWQVKGERGTSERGEAERRSFWIDCDGEGVPPVTAEPATSPTPTASGRSSARPSTPSSSPASAVPGSPTPEVSRQPADASRDDERDLARSGSTVPAGALAAAAASLLGAGVYLVLRRRGDRSR